MAHRIESITERRRVGLASALSFGMGVLTLLFACGGWWLLRRAREALKAGDGGPFALTLGELRRDRAGLEGPEPPRQAP